MWNEHWENTDIWLSTVVRVSKTGCLTRVGVSRSDSRHEADPSFHAISKVPKILEALTALVMGKNNGVNETHQGDSILEASQEHLGGQVM